MSPARFLGLRTAIYPVTDLPRATAWYRAALGVAPYFDQPFYVGFNVGGFELGLVPEPSKPAAGAPGGLAYWGVERMDETWAHLIEQGAEPLEPARDVGEGIQVATVKDPFGNRIGIIENPHFPNTA